MGVRLSPRDRSPHTLHLLAASRDHQSGGSAPEEGAGETAEQLARKALAERGLTPHLDTDSGSTWLVIGHPVTGRVPDMAKKPHILLSVCNEDDDEWTVDRPAHPGDEWQVVTDDGAGTEETLMTRPANQLAPCIAVIAEWITQSRT